MKTTLKLIIGSLVLSSAAFAGNPAPDFVGAAPRPHIDRSLVASSGTSPIEPGDIVPFANDTAQLTESGYAQVDRTALWLKVHPRQFVVLEGHASPPGAEPYNDDLSMLRAEAIRRRLIQNGISKSRIIMVARGERADLLSPAERHVRVYATKLTPQVIYAMSAPSLTTPPSTTQTARR